MADDMQDIFRELTQGTQTSEEIIEYRRELEDGSEKVDFRIIERMNLADGMPSTEKLYITSAPLPCGHIISKENIFGGRCSKCNKEYCDKCELICYRCHFISSRCCIKPYRRKALLCKKCRWVMRLKSFYRFCVRPFKEQEDTTDVVEELLPPEPREDTTASA